LFRADLSTRNLKARPAMLLILDIDFTLNRIPPPHVSSLRDLAPLHIARADDRVFYDWLTRHLQSTDYPPRDDAVAVVQALSRHASHIMVNTGRPEPLRESTKRWLIRYFPFTHLFMRKPHDFRHNCEVKGEHLRERIFPLLRDAEPVWAFEDDPETLSMYAQEGVRTFAAPRCWGELYSALGRATVEARFKR
jgi:hypothetical protein